MNLFKLIFVFLLIMILHGLSFAQENELDTAQNPPNIENDDSPIRPAKKPKPAVEPTTNNAASSPPPAAIGTEKPQTTATAPAAVDDDPVTEQFPLTEPPAAGSSPAPLATQPSTKPSAQPSAPSPTNSSAPSPTNSSPTDSAERTTAIDKANSESAAVREAPKALPSSPRPPIKKDLIDFPQNYLHFAPEQNGVKVSKPLLKYEVDSAPDEDIRINGILFNKETFKPWISPAKDLFKSFKSSYEPSQKVFLLTMPAAIGSTGELLIIREDGQTLLSQKITSETLEQNELLKNKIPKEFWNNLNADEISALFINIEGIQSELLDGQSKTGYRFCWRREEDSYFSKFCTPYYRYSKNRKAFRLQTQASSSRVYINNKQSPLAHTYVFDRGSDLRFLATSKQGYSIEFYSPEPSFTLTDYFLASTDDWVYIAGEGDFAVYPNSKKWMFLDEKSLVAFFQWNPTMGDLKNRWITVVPRNQMELTLSSKGGGIFLITLEADQIPSMASLIEIKNPLKSTYSGQPKLTGTKPAAAEVSAPKGPNDVRLNKAKSSFQWAYNAAKKGEKQTQYLNVTQNKNTYKAGYSLFRGYSSEFSLRLAGVLSSDLSLNLLGEASYNQWFETLFGWENYYFGRQRWGIAARTFTPLTTFSPQGGTSDKLVLQLTTFDLKYRFTPGLWERDETWGMILGYENVTINSISGTFLGGGFFWARSMPQVFDRIFNWFPFMNYPKWVDMEFILFTSSLKSDVTLGGSPTSAINFHGKILWKKYFFGEAGFGVKTYSYQKGSAETILQALYGTAGLGFNF